MRRSRARKFLVDLSQEAQRRQVSYQDILNVVIQINLRIEPWEIQKRLAKQRRKREQAQRKERVIVKKYDFRGSHFDKCILTIDSNLTQATQTLSVVPQADRDQVRQLVEKLREELKKVPQERLPDAEAVSEAGKELLDKAAKPSPNKRSIEISGKGLIEAAKALAVVVPTVLPVATKIAELVSRWFP